MLQDEAFAAAAALVGVRIRNSSLCILYDSNGMYGHPEPHGTGRRVRSGSSSSEASD